MNNYKKKNKLIIFTVLFVMITAISIGYSAFATTLKINGSSNFLSMSWNVHFAYPEDANRFACDINDATNCYLVPIVTGTARVLRPPKIDETNTKIEHYVVNLYNQGDKIEYYFDVCNDSVFNAQLAEIEIPTSGVTSCPEDGNCVICEGYGTNKTNDENAVCSHLSYVLTYADGSQLQIGDALKSRARIRLKLTLTYSITASTMPSDDVTISNLDISLKYVQSS